MDASDNNQTIQPEQKDSVPPHQMDRFDELEKGLDKLWKDWEESGEIQKWIMETNKKLTPSIFSRLRSRFRYFFLCIFYKPNTEREEREKRRRMWNKIVFGTEEAPKLPRTWDEMHEMFKEFQKKRQLSKKENGESEIH